MNPATHAAIAVIVSLSATLGATATHAASEPARDVSGRSTGGVGDPGRAGGAVSHKIAFNIPAQSLGDALAEWSRQSGLQILRREGSNEKDITTAPLSGEFSATEALERLLTNSGLGYEFINDHTVRIGVRNAVHAGEVDRRSATTADTAKGITSTQTALGTPGPSPTPDESTDAAADRQAPALDEVIVTGSHIRGATNRTAPVTIYTRDDIARTGYTTIQQFVQSIPQNFGGDPGGVSEDGNLGAGTSRATNIESATGINLRGLGVGATLVLINGHRVAPSANAAAVDVSIIPLAAVERVEVLTDGSSAIYGSEAIAGVVNFILRSNYEGAETSASVGTTTDGGPNEQIVAQTLGTRWDTGNVLFSTQYQHRNALGAAERDFTANVPEPTDILPKRNQTNFLLSARQQLPLGLDVFGQALYTRADIDNVNAQVGGEFARTQTDGFNQNFSAGVGYEAGADWRIELVGLYARQYGAIDGEATPVGYFGPLDFTRNFVLSSGELKADGPLLNLPSGAVKAAVGGGYRSESYDVEPLDPKISRHVSSAYAEVSVPIVGPLQARSWLRDVELSAAVRYDDYSDFGNTTNPRVGIAWSPAVGLTLRAAYSTSFRAPNANELDLTNRGGSQLIVPYPFQAPNGVGTVPALLIVGSKALEPEKSRSWTYGLTFQPQQVPGLNLTFNFYRIEDTNRIDTPPFALNVLQHPDVYGNLIQTYANDAAAQAAVNSFVAAGGSFRDVFGLGLAGIRYGYDDRLQNFASVAERGFDVGANYGFTVGQEDFRAALQVTNIDEIMTSYGVGTHATNLVNTIANPLRWRGRSTFGWSHGIWSANSAVNYSNAYSDTTVTPSAPIDAWITLDLNARVALGGDAPHSWLHGTSVAVSVINVLDKSPPAIVGSGLYPAGFDVANASPLGRFVTLMLRKSW